MVLAFKPQFVNPILEGKKLHTLRLDPKNRWAKDKSIQMATGIRTPNYSCFKNDVCKSVQILYFMYNPESKHLTISLEGGKPFTEIVKRELALNDGFENYEAFVEWFAPLLIYEPYFSQQFKLIHWTDKQY